MTFIRGTINAGLREALKQEVIKEEFNHPRPDNDFIDIEFLRYVSSAEKSEWFEFHSQLEVKPSR